MGNVFTTFSQPCRSPRDVPARQAQISALENMTSAGALTALLVTMAATGSPSISKIISLGVQNTP